MTTEQIANSIACCGLICMLCRPDRGCDCHNGNLCGKRLAPDGCYQYRCCAKKGFRGCWECDSAPCDKDMHAADHVKIRAFVRCIKEDGLLQFSRYIQYNAERGIVYHRNGIHGDYDLATEEEVLQLLRGSVSLPK